MAKAFSDNEKTQIVSRLKEIAKKCLLESEIRKTSVDELAKAAGISKGAFYFFFRSKEELFFEVINEYHDTAQESIAARFASVREVSPGALTAILYSSYRDISLSFLPKLISGGELEILMRRLPPDVVASHQDDDNAFFSKIFSLLPHLGPADCVRYSAAFRGIFLMLLHKREIGETVFDEVLEMLITGVVRNMFGEVNP